MDPKIAAVRFLNSALPSHVFVGDFGGMDSATLILDLFGPAMECLDVFLGLMFRH